MKYLITVKHTTMPHYDFAYTTNVITRESIKAKCLARDVHMCDKYSAYATSYDLYYLNGAGDFVYLESNPLDIEHDKL